MLLTKGEGPSELTSKVDEKRPNLSRPKMKKERPKRLKPLVNGDRFRLAKSGGGAIRSSCAALRSSKKGPSTTLSSRKAGKSGLLIPRTRDGDPKRAEL